MSRISKIFASPGKKLVTYVVAGDPDAIASLAALHDLTKSGADIIELGMPFTDPVADGPAIQASALRALEKGMTLRGVLELVSAFRRNDDTTPIVLMGYFNPIFSYGCARFATDARQAGADGVLIVDLPPEEEDELALPCRDAGLDFIRLATPTTDAARLDTILRNASGFLYYVSVAGITGTASADAETLAPRILSLKTQTNLPICIGFGIKTPDDAKAMGKICDGIVVGSAIVERLHRGEDAAGLVAGLRHALDTPI